MENIMITKINKKRTELSLAVFRTVKDILERLMPVFGFRLKNYYDESDFPWLRVLEAHADKIKAEYLRNTDLHKLTSVQDINNQLQDFSYDDGWRVILLKSYDTIIHKNADLYPDTMNTIRQIPGVTNAIFSVLVPGKQIQLHRGMYRGVVFIHLGVVVPTPVEQYTFIVNGERKHWEEGKAFGFEDSFMHEVVNTSGQYRTILLLEVERPDIPLLLRPVHRWILKRMQASQNTEKIIENARLG